MVEVFRITTFDSSPVNYLAGHIEEVSPVACKTSLPDAIL